jgi:transcriptional regulator NrdR family protein
LAILVFLERVVNMQIRVLKADGQIEPYLHTKVLGTFHNALALAGDSTLFAADQMAEAVTFYLYAHKPTGPIPTDAVHRMIESVLTATGFVRAAEALDDYRLKRRLKRRRIVVLGDADPDGGRETTEWSKKRLAESLVRTYRVDPLTARAIAGAVEEKVLAMNVTRLGSSLLRQLILGDMETFLEAGRQLQAATA